MVYCFLACFATSGCKKKLKDKAELIAFVADTGNGLHKEEIINQIKTELTYRPALLMAGSAKLKKRWNDSAFLRNKLFFVLSFSANNKELLRQLDFNNYSRMVPILSFRMQEFVRVYPDNKQPIAPVSCIFQQNFGLGSANNILLAFKEEEILSANKVRFKIAEFGLGTGDQTFDFDVRNIKNIPKTNFN